MIRIYGAGQWVKYVLNGYGLEHSNSVHLGDTHGPNKDPIFYAHHGFTCLLNDFGFKTVLENSKATASLYGVDEVIERRDVKECPDHNPADITVYRNIVWYKKGQGRR